MTFYFSPESFIFGLNVMIHGLTSYNSALLYRSRLSRFYLSLLAIACARLIEITLGVCVMNFEYGPQTTSLEVIQQALGWFCQCGFTLLNFKRLQSLISKDMPRTVAVLKTVVSIAIILSSAVNIICIVASFLRDAGESIVHISELVTFAYSSYSVVDAFVNGIIAAAFILHLHTITKPKAGMPTFREGFSKLLRHVTLLLVAESALVIGVNIAQLSSSTWDPQWSSAYFAEAFRLRCFCGFLAGLADLMHSRVSNTHSGGGGHRSHGGASHDGGTGSTSQLASTAHLSPTKSTGSISALHTTSTARLDPHSPAHGTSETVADDDLPATAPRAAIPIRKLNLPARVTTEMSPEKKRYVVWIRGRKYKYKYGDMVGMGERQGEGRRSLVFQAFPEGTKPIAIKRIRLNADSRDSVTHEVHLESRRLYLVMELGEMDMAKLMELRAERPIDLDFIRYYWRSMVEIVNELHRHEIIHGSLKPASFVVVKSELKLIDLGIMRTAASNMATANLNSQAGAVDYMSPEAILVNAHTQRDNMVIASASSSSTADETPVDAPKTATPLTTKADVWSIGCILYQLLYGCAPFSKLTTEEKLSYIASPEYPIAYPRIRRGMTPSALDALVHGPLGRDGANPASLHVQVSTPDVQFERTALVVDCIQLCLQRDPEARADIETLLCHPFLQPEESLEERWFAQRG
ncbi:Serine/threonine kinase mps1 [Blastocladiella emersonii ATCC 22665]|nr:Serine/threonine kinase mps1 [Blastocladiella emersonii ATCC 22665]